MQLCKMQLEHYLNRLKEEEKSTATIKKYAHDLKLFSEWLGEREIAKCMLIAYKEYLTERYCAASVNSMLAAVNGFLCFAGLEEWKLKPLKIQRSIFADEKKELTYGEYCLLLQAAKEKDERLYIVLQTICATGIRVSELQFITVESLQRGKLEIINKGKRRIVFLTSVLSRLLRGYIKRKNIKKGAIFVTKSGRPLDRSNLWRAMKTICEKAGVNREKVFPHNLRHLFARKHYEKFKDLSRLADILGHSNINTTRIYTMESGLVHARQLEELGLFVV